MATTTNTNNTADYTTLAESVQTFSNDATTDMKTFAAAQTARTTRLTAVLTRLQKNSKTPPAIIAKLNNSISVTSNVAQTMGGLATRIAVRPTVDPSDLAVFGQVLDAKGAPAAGVYVRLSDSAGTLTAGSRVKTDASGDFSLVLKACELPATATQGLLVAVEDASGARLTASNPITPKAGSPVYVDLALNAAAVKPA
jgi:hypothetical protein